VHNTDSMDRCRWAWPLSVGTHQASDGFPIRHDCTGPAASFEFGRSVLVCSAPPVINSSFQPSIRPDHSLIAFAINPLDVPFFFAAHQTSLAHDSIFYITPAHHHIPIRLLISLLKPTRSLQSNANPNLPTTFTKSIG